MAICSTNVWFADEAISPNAGDSIRNRQILRKLERHSRRISAKISTIAREPFPCYLSLLIYL
jgi:hypothetical protein